MNVMVSVTFSERIGRGGLAALRGLGLYLVTVIGGVLCTTLFMTGISLLSIGLGLFLIPIAALAMRWFADRMRGLIGSWTGVRIQRPYLPEPADKGGINGWLQRTGHALSDPATWRDMLWMYADPVVAGFTALLPAFLIVNGTWGLVLAAGFWQPIHDMGGTEWYLFVPMNGWEMVPAVALLGGLQFFLGFRYAESLLALYGRWSRLLLAPTEKSRLALRVQQLTETRSDAVDASAAELRRIERDLHDGAQARLVAMGMSLGAIEHLLDRDPDKARLLLAEARASSAKALGELRDLVRGIHPPVLADRGLGDAVRALALDHPLQVEVITELPGRPEAPVESAAYFAVAEVLTNAAKHSGAQRVWVDLRYADGMLRITVTDDGHGGATARGGSGLSGIERRIGTFDGVLALNSPPGGPTIVTMELPCELSWPKTSPS